MLTESQIKDIRKGFQKNEWLFSSVFYALGDPGRLRAFKVLFQHQDICVSEIAAILKVSVPAASRQLKILEQAGLARRERNGQMICYRIPKENPMVRSVIQIIQMRPKGRRAN